MRDLQEDMRDLHDIKILLHINIRVMIDLLSVLNDLPANIIDIDQVIAVDLHHLTVIIAGDLILDAPPALIVNLLKAMHIRMYLILRSLLI